MSLSENIGEVLISEAELAEINKRLGAQITADYEGKNLFVVGVLKGSLVFMADLIRHIDVPCELDFLSVSSYGDGTVSSGTLKIKKDLEEDITGKNVIVVEDIIDSGRTLKYLKEDLKGRGAKSVKLCALLSKPARHEVEVEVEYIGYEIPDEFVVGYGLDYAQKYRNLPYIGIVEFE